MRSGDGDEPHEQVCQGRLPVGEAQYGAVPGTVRTLFFYYGKIYKA